ncbi:MAG: hypothetical protein R3223_09110 [Longimicrobiales bacterium]|nr:hypothetical protein [Longimicrobiales bacterium]
MLLAVQVVVAGMIPTVDAGVEAEALSVHATWHASISLHSEHPTHDHRDCEFCRTISSVAGPAPAVEPPRRLDDAREVRITWSHQVPLDRTSFLPIGPRAPPAA